MPQLLFIFSKLILITEILTSFENGFLVISSKIRLKKSVAERDENNLWSEGIVPYQIDDTFNGELRRYMKQIMREWEKSTCIKFTERYNEIHPDYLLITRSGYGCSSEIGKRLHGPNYLRLSKGCLPLRTVLHELGHAIGFFHEHNRPDRDQYVILKTENLEFGDEGYFSKLSPESVTTLNQTYDYDSIMHYARNEYSSDPLKDILVPLDTASGKIDRIGKMARLSDIDITATNLLYKCPECGKTLYDTKGLIESVIDVNNSLKSNKYCQWTITAARGERIVLNVTSLNIRKSKNCTSDYLEINDGCSRLSPLIARFCGKGNTSQAFISTSNRVLVTYVRKFLKKNKPGFTLNYRKVCGGNIYIKDEDQLYYLESPDYPYEYEANKKCIWHLTAKPNRKISIEFDYFKLENPSAPTKDFLAIRDGPNYSSPLIGIYFDKNNPRTVNSTGNELFIKFVSYNSMKKNGFSAIITLKKN